jgi:AcrR family transcriptional regulator
MGILNEESNNMKTGNDQLPSKTNARSAKAAEQRERMRVRLMCAAIHLCTSRGIDSGAIDDVIKLAGVSRGTFYNYFKTAEELLEAVATELGDEVVSVAEPLVLKLEDPAARVSCGIRTCLGLGERHRQMAAFIGIGGAKAQKANRQLSQALMRDVMLGIEAGRFSPVDAQLAFDLVVGTVVAGFLTIAEGNTKPGYIEDLSMSVLQALGLNKSSARKVSRLPMQDFLLAEKSLIVQSDLFNHGESGA